MATADKPKKFFKTVKKGDRPSAGEWTKITDTLSGMTGQRGTKKTYSKIRLVKTAEVMGRFLRNSSQQQKDREMSFRYWDKNTETFQDGDRPSVANLCDPFDLVYDEDEYLLAFYSEQGTKFYPINPRTVRHAITCRDANNNYPTRGGDTYPIRWVKLTYVEMTGFRGHTITYLNGDNPDPDSPGAPPAVNDDWVHNIVPPGEAFIPVGTLIQCYNVTRQWFTQFCCEIEESSESGSYSSFSSSSSSSSHSSSSSLSSSSSQSSQSSSSISHSSSLSSSISSSASSVSSESSSQSISESSSSSLSGSASSESSSRGSSLSSQSEVSSSISRSFSSASISESSGYECIDFVECWSFDEEACEATVTYGRICFPAGLGITVDHNVEAPAC